MTPDTGSYIGGRFYNIFKGEVSPTRTPIYPYFAEIIEKIGGTEHLYDNIVLIQKILFIISIIVFFYTLEKILNNKKLSIIMTLVYSLSPFLFMWNTLLLTESLSIIEAVVLFYLTVSYIRNPKKYMLV